MAADNRRYAPLLTLGLCLLLLTAGSRAATDTSSDHLARAARGALTTVEGESDWVLAATELALGLYAQGQNDHAKTLVTTAQQRAGAIADPLTRATALTTVAETLIQMELFPGAAQVLREAQIAAHRVEDSKKQWDLRGKFIIAHAQTGEAAMAFESALAMPESDETLAAYKSRTLHDIAPIQARRGDLQGAQQTLSSITMGMSYYRVAATADVVSESYTKDTSAQLDTLLMDAIAMARAQTDGYFVAGALRHLAVAYAHMGNSDASKVLFLEALEASRKGVSPQHRARATSRVATSMADLGRFEAAARALPAAIALAREEDREPFRLFALYEIAGSAAFSGDLDTALALLKEIPGEFAFGNNTLRWATQRDVAWGMARHGQWVQAVELATAIPSPRERIQALSRMLRLQADPDMVALPRYL